MMSGSCIFLAQDCNIVGTDVTFAAEVTFSTGDAIALLRVESDPARSQMIQLFESSPGRGFRLEVYDSGGLRLERFLGCEDLLVAPDPDYESWTLTLDSGEMFVSRPGGGILHWAARDSR
jgi:hypothetical protein